MSSTPRIKIRCPNCLNDGSARAELINRRVSCKHCSHTFRVTPVDDQAASTAVSDGAKVSSPVVPDAGEAGSPQGRLALDLESVKKGEAVEASLREEIGRLRDQLDQAGSAGVEGPGRGLREEELRFLRDQLDKARAEAEAEARRRRESAASLTARTAEHTRALASKEAEHAQALAAKEDEHAEVVRPLRDQFAQVRADARSIEARRLASDATWTRAENRLADEAQDLRDELGRTRAELAEARQALDGLRLDGERASAEQARAIEELRGRLAEAERLVAEHKDVAEASRLDRERIEAAHPAELAELRDQLERARVGQGDLESIRRERDEARIQRDRIAEELDGLRASLEEADRMVAGWDYPSTELEVPRAVVPVEVENLDTDPESATVFEDDGPTQQADLDRSRAEAESLRLELEEARASAEATSRSNLELTDRIRALEAEHSLAAIDPAVFEAGLKKAVDEAVKGAWADFERRLAETQAKLKAANSRADLMEVEAREAHEQLAAREQGPDLGDGSSFGEGASMTSIRILNDRGTTRLTQADAEARLALAKQLAVERKDKSLIDRIGKMADKVHADLEARNYTLAETLVRGAEIETGLDPGGFSINGLRIFRASPTIVASLSALAPAFDGVMRQGDLASIRSTIEEMRTILGDQAGLPELRRVGRTPAIKRPIARVDALRLFVGALEGESWLVRPIASKKPLPDTALTTYAAWIEGCCGARESAQEHAPDRLPLLDGVIQASCSMLTRRQQADGHFSFLDPRGRASKAASVVDAMVAQRPDAVKDGWVIQVDPVGMAQVETGACAIALATAGKALGRGDWSQATQKAADWAMGQPCLPNFVANAASSGLLARAYLDARQDRHLAGLARKLGLGLLPGQVENGRWIDASSATTPNHLAILRALHDAWEAIPGDRDDLRRDLKPAIVLAMASLLAECQSLGVPPQGNALRDLIRHRGLFPDDPDPRLAASILDSVTVIQELCHDGPKPKLGVAPDQLAALVRA